MIDRFLYARQSGIAGSRSLGCWSFFKREGRWIARARRLTWVGVVRLDHLLVTVEDLLPEIERKGGGDRSAVGFVGCCQLAEV